MMQEILLKLIGKKVDLYCGGTSSLHGKVVKVDAGVAHLVSEEDRMFYVAIDRIAVLSESRDNEQRAGFVAGFHR